MSVLMSWQIALQYERDFIADKQRKIQQMRHVAIHAPALQELLQYAEQALAPAQAVLQMLEQDLTRLYYAAMGQPLSPQDATLLANIPPQNLWASIQWLDAKRVIEQERPSQIFLTEWRIHTKKAIQNIKMLVEQPQTNPQAFAMEINQICTFLADFETTPVDRSAGNVLKKALLPTFLGGLGFAIGRMTDLGDGLIPTFG